MHAVWHKRGPLIPESWPIGIGATSPVLSTPLQINVLVVVVVVSDEQ